MYLFPIEQHIKQASLKRSKRRQYVLTIVKASAVRFLLICHNIATTWQVALLRKSWAYWMLAFGNFFILGEGVYIIMERDGLEQKWYSPWMIVYMLTTLPTIWLLQLALHDQFQTRTTNTTMLLNNSPGNQTVMDFDFSFGITVGTDGWIMLVVQEMMIYLLVLGKWILPRGGVTRAALSELLLEYLAMGTDIMEFFSIFEIDNVRTSLSLTITILTIWSLSFLQFIPVILRRGKSLSLTLPGCTRLNRHCADHLADFLITLMTFFLQDGPFLAVRLYIIIQFNVVSYSLVFFVVKNIIVIMLLCYRMTILCMDLPGRLGEHSREDNVISTPSHVDSLAKIYKSDSFSTQNNMKNSTPGNPHDVQYL